MQNENLLSLVVDIRNQPALVMADVKHNACAHAVYISPTLLYICKFLHAALLVILCQAAKDASHSERLAQASRILFRLMILTTYLRILRSISPVKIRAY